MDIIDMPKKTRNTFWFRYEGKAHHIDLGSGPKEQAQRRLASLKAGDMTLPPDADLFHYLRTGQLSKKESPAAKSGPAEQMTIRQILRWALERPALVEKSARNRAELEADHIANLRRAVRYAEVALDVDSPPPLTPADLQAYIDQRLTEPKLQPLGRPPSAKTLRDEVTAIRALYDAWAGLNQQPPVPRTKLTYPPTQKLGEFRPLTETITKIKTHGLTGEEARRAWHESFPTVGECRELLQFVKDRAKDPWLPAVVAWAIHTGCRASEARRASWADWDRESKVWECRERKREDDTVTRRSVPIRQELAGLMNEWLAVRPADSEYLFCRVEDDPHHKAGAKLGRNQIWQALHRVLDGSKWAGFPGLHRFRHGLRSNALSAGQSHEQIDQIVGHTTEEMRRRYTHADRQVKLNALDAIFGEG